MVHAQYVKDIDAQQIRLYFDGVPPKVVLTQLKGNGWHWNPHELYWGASLTKHNEDFEPLTPVIFTFKGALRALKYENMRVILRHANDVVEKYISEQKAN